MLGVVCMSCTVNLHSTVNLRIMTLLPLKFFLICIFGYVQCADPRCLVQQHISCVIISEKPMEEIPLLPPPFFCETCRIKRADPYVFYIFHILFCYVV